MGGGEWATSAIPLSNVSAISFADDERGVATGNTSECARGVAVTNNGGRTWKYRQDNPVLLDAWYQGNTIWGIERVVGQPVLAAYTRGQPPAVASRSRALKPDPAVRRRRRRPRPDRVLGRHHRAALLRERRRGVAPAGAHHQRGRELRAARRRPARLSGLDGGGSVLDMDVAGTETVWLQITAEAGCSEGQLRESDSQGAVFTRLPCPSKSVEINEMLDVAFTSETDGVMLALLDRAAGHVRDRRRRRLLEHQLARSAPGEDLPSLSQPRWARNWRVTLQRSSLDATERGSHRT